MDSVIPAAGTEADFVALWMNFAMANYTKELTSPSLPERMRYAQRATSRRTNYPRPPIEVVTALSIGATVGPDRDEMEP